MLRMEKSWVLVIFEYIVLKIIMLMYLSSYLSEHSVHTQYAFLSKYLCTFTTMKKTGNRRMHMIKENKAIGTG